MNFAQVSQQRYTAKAYDSSRKVPEETLNELLTLLRFSPSSVNSQPWHFIVFSSDAAKQQLATAVGEAFSFNQPKVRDASHSILFCVKEQLSDAHLQAVLAQEDRDGRFASPEAKAANDRGRVFFSDLHRKTLNDTDHWMEKQLYLALGCALLAAGAMGLDATPIEGFDREGVDKAFGLKEKGLKSVVLMPLGYRSEGDFNAKLPKSRLPEDKVITRL